MDEGSLDLCWFKYMHESIKDFRNNNRVGDLATISHNFSKITSWDNSGWLIYLAKLSSHIPLQRPIKTVFYSSKKNNSGLN